MKHTEHVRYKEDLYRFLYASLIWSKEIIYEGKNEVHSISFNRRFCKHTTLLNQDDTCTFYIADQGITSNWQLLFQSATSSLKWSIMILTLLFKQPWSIYLLRENFARLKPLKFCIHSPFAQVLKQFSTAVKCYWNSTFKLNSDNDIFKKQKYEKMEYNNNNNKIAELNWLQPSF